MPLLQALSWLADISLVLLNLGLLLLFVIAMEIGFRLGRRWVRTHPEPAARDGVGFVTAGMLALLAFLLGTALSLAQARYESRRAVVLDEANAIGTVYLRAGVIGGQEGATMQRLLHDYTRARIAFVEHQGTRAEIDALNAQAATLQNAIWAEAQTVAQARPTPISGLMLQSLNEMIDLSLTARRDFSTGVPVHLLQLLLWAAIITVAGVGFHFGVGKSRQVVLSTVLLAFWSTGLVLIVDINRPRQGNVVVNAGPLIWTLQGFGPAPAAR